MLEIRCKTNIDAYHQVKFPVLSVIPRKGEIVCVAKESESYCNYNKIPPRLSVCQVYYKDNGVVEIDLWFSDVDHKLYNGPRILANGHGRE